MQPECVQGQIEEGSQKSAGSSVELRLDSSSVACVGRHPYWKPPPRPQRRIKVQGQSGNHIDTLYLEKQGAHNQAELHIMVEELLPNSQF